MLRIHALGGLRVQENGRVVSGAAAQPRRMAVLALIARAGERGVTRDKLLALLWPDADEEQGRRVLKQALYTLRRDLGAEEALTGTKELRLNSEVITCDVLDFEAALAAGELERAVGHYEGPFLDGFRLPGAPEFERWTEDVRAELAFRYADTVETLARRAADRGELRAAVGWWRKLAALDPLNAQVAIELMQALVAAGDRNGALQHARIYEALLEQELDLPPDREVLDLAERIRSEPLPAPRPAVLPTPATVVVESPGFGSPPGMAPPPDLPVAEEGAPELPASAVALAPPPPAPSVREAATEAGAPARVSIPAIAPPAPRPRVRLWPWMLALAAALLAVAAVAAPRLRTTAPVAVADETPVLAVGRISDYTGAPSGAAALADMLSTNLARTPGLRVISTPRLYALLQSGDGGGDFGAAAQEAGASGLLEGSIYRTAGGGLRLDLRRIDLASRAVVGAYVVEGMDLFALADSGTARLVADLGVRAPAGGLAEVTTRSVVAYRFYEEGLRAYFQGNLAAAERLFESALAEDSTFAMAAYYSARSVADDRPRALARMRTALRLATAAAGDRERLIIASGLASDVSDPRLRVLADSLATRFPDEVEGHLYLGFALLIEGAYLEALEPLRRALAMDSLSLHGGRFPCGACTALRQLVSAYELADSLPAAEREARRWIELQPSSVEAWRTLAEVLALAGHGEEAVAADERAATLEPSRSDGAAVLAESHLREGDFAAADAALRAQLRSGTSPQRQRAHHLLLYSLRQQGRLREALKLAEQRRAAGGQRSPPGAAPPLAATSAQVLHEMGRFREAAALYDSIARWTSPDEDPFHLASHRAWYLVHTAGAYAAAGDTLALLRLTDSVRVIGGGGLHVRGHRLPHHLRGLLLAARGDDAQAAAELRRALYSPNLGYTRTNLELARVLLREQRPQEAVAVLQPALRGSLWAANAYVTRTELHEGLAHAWEAAGQPDSAAFHYQRVVQAWQRADPPLAERRRQAEARLAALRER